MLINKYSFILRGEINLTEKDKELIKKLNISKDKILWNETMKNYTTFKIGGEAECLIKIDNEKTLAEILVNGERRRQGFLLNFLNRLSACPKHSLNSSTVFALKLV